MIRHVVVGGASDGHADDGHDPGVLFASGLIAGEALIGIFMTVLIIREVPLPKGGESILLSLILYGGVLASFVYVAASKRRAQ